MKNRLSSLLFALVKQNAYLSKNLSSKHDPLINNDKLLSGQYLSQQFLE